MSIMEKEEWDVCMKHLHRSVGQLKRRKREKSNANEEMKK